MDNNSKKRQEEYLVQEKKELEKLEKKEKRRRIMIFSLAVVSIAGFAFSLLLLVGITGAVIGPSRGNFWGLIFIVLSLLIWTVAETLWLKGKKNSKVDVKKLLENAEKEGLPMMSGILKSKSPRRL